MNKRALGRILIMLILSIGSLTALVGWNYPVCVDGKVYNYHLGGKHEDEKKWHEAIAAGGYEMVPGSPKCYKKHDKPTPQPTSVPEATSTPVGSVATSTSTPTGPSATSTSTAPQGNGSAASTSTPTGPISSTTAPSNTATDDTPRGPTPDQTEIWYCVKRAPSNESPTGLVNIKIHRDGVMAHKDELVFWVVPGKSPKEQACTDQQIREGLSPKPTPTATTQPVSAPSGTTTSTSTPIPTSTPTEEVVITTTDETDTTTIPSEVVSDAPVCARPDGSEGPEVCETSPPLPLTFAPEPVETPTPFVVPDLPMPLPEGCRDYEFCGYGRG